MKHAQVAACLALAASTVAADELFVSIQSAAPMAQGARLVLAGQTLEQKATVRVLPCDAAGDIAPAEAGRARPVVLIARGEP